MLGHWQFLSLDALVDVFWCIECVQSADWGVVAAQVWETPKPEKWSYGCHRCHGYGLTSGTLVYKNVKSKVRGSHIQYERIHFASWGHSRKSSVNVIGHQNVMKLSVDNGLHARVAKGHWKNQAIHSVVWIMKVIPFRLGKKSVSGVCLTASCLLAKNEIKKKLLRWKKVFVAYCTEHVEWHEAVLDWMFKL